MSKKKSEVINEPRPTALGSSNTYRIDKHGMYQYQVVRIDPDTQAETPVGPPNVFGIVVSDLADRLFNEIALGK